MNTPILNAIRGYSGKRFHVPGHKGRLGPLGKAARWDVTELGFSDNLLEPTGCIAEAEALFAEAYGGECALFLTCGATGGVLAALSLLAGKSVILWRDSHASCYSALELFRIAPIFCDDRVRAGHVPELAELEAALAEHPEAAGVFLTYPDYYGRTAELAEISRAARRAGKLLIVDASHGSHYAFSPLLPENPVPYADVTVLSLHKTGLALTQAAALCAKSRLRSALLEAVARLHTTSPSYLILGTIDFSRAYMVQYYGKIAIGQQAAVVRLAGRLEGTGFTAVRQRDFTRLTVLTGSLPGFAAEAALKARGVYPEFGDFTGVTFVVSAADKPGQIAKLAGCLAKIAAGAPVSVSPPSPPAFTPPRALPYLEAVSRPSERIPLADSAGRIAARNVGLYPPATPLLLGGELITRELAALLQACAGHTFGVAEGKIEVLQ